MKVKVTVFVPIQMTIEGEDKVSAVHRVLNLINEEIHGWELDAQPNINVDLVGDAEIVEDIEE
jgi:hypothetical protein